MRLRVALAAVVVGSLVVSAGLSAAHDPDPLGWHRVDDAANSTTYVGVQGFSFRGQTDPSRPGRLVAVGPRGETRWTWNGSGRTWVYDVEPVNRTHLLVTTGHPDGARATMLDPRTREVRWRERFDARDTHDVDWAGNGTLWVAPMRKDYYEDGQRRFDDRAFRYDRRTDRETWSWNFTSAYEPPESAPPTGWTHLNDVDRVNDTHVLLSPRNFDQVILVDTRTGAVTARLGSPGDHDVLHRQHNPDVLDTDPLTVLVADSENDRVVEYVREDGGWTRTWTLSGGLRWPRDADRLPNGNTLVTDTLNHRVVEVTPTGEVVWEYYAPWAPYDADRAGTGDGSHGPTAREAGAPANATLSGGAVGSTGAAGRARVCGAARDVPDPNTVPVRLRTATAGTPLADVGRTVADAYAQHVPWLRPRWLSPWAVPTLGVGVVTLVAWGAGEAVAAVRRRR